jgi:hypothetical protein
VFLVNFGLLVRLIVKSCCCCRREGVFMPVNCCRREGLAKQVDRLAQMRLSTVRLDLRLRRHRPLPTPPSTATIPSSPSPGPTSPPSRWASPRTKNHQRGERGERPARGRDPGRGRGSGRISVAGRPDGRRRGIGGAVDGEFDGLGSRNFSFFFHEFGVIGCFQLIVF